MFQSEFEVHGYMLPRNPPIHPFDSRTGTATRQHGCLLCYSPHYSLGLKYYVFKVEHISVPHGEGPKGLVLFTFILKLCSIQI